MNERMNELYYYYKSEYEEVCKALRQRNKDLVKLKQEIVKLQKENEELKKELNKEKQIELLI